MFVTCEAEVTIKASAEEIWDFVNDPDNWTASNPEEHYGLTYDTPDNRPCEGATFHQREEVAGIFANLYGRFQYINQPEVAVWSGTAYYGLLFGLVSIRVPEGGTIRLERTGEETRMSHSVWVDFPNSWWGSFLKWNFLKLRDGRDRLYEHTKKELNFFKEHLET